MTARLYARVSTIQQTEGYSLAAQRARLDAWAAYQGIRDTVMYEDAGLSGARDDRPGLAALLLDLQPGDVVVTPSINRLARGGAVQLLGIIARIREKQARVVFLAESMDTETYTGRLLLTMLAGIAEMEIEQTRERTNNGRTQAALEGVYPHSPTSLPMGWTADEDGHIIEDTTHAPTVRLIFEQGSAPYNATADMLNAAGIPALRGGRWQVPQVRRIVLFMGYATGQLVYRASTRPDDTDAHVVIPAPQLITVKTWQAAQRDGRLNHAHAKPDTFPLTGHLRCACGAKLGGRTKEPLKPTHARSWHYVCYERLRKTPTCPTNGLNTRVYSAAPLHAAARAALADMLRNPSDPVHLASAYGGGPTDPNAEERASMDRKMGALLDLYLEGVIDRATYDARRAAFTARLATLSPPALQHPPAMPPQDDMARAALECSNTELAELLDILDAEFMADGNSVKLVHYRPLSQD